MDVLVVEAADPSVEDRRTLLDLPPDPLTSAPAERDLPDVKGDFFSRTRRRPRARNLVWSVDSSERTHHPEGRQGVCTVSLKARVRPPVLRHLIQWK